MQLIEIDGKNIKLSSGMTEESFSKTRFASLITEKGLVAQCKTEASDKNFSKLNFTFSEWSFSSIKSQDNIVFYEGSFDFLSDSSELKTLAALLEDKKTAIKAGKSVCTAIIQAVKAEKNIPLNGGGILVSLGDSQITLVFLPETVFLNCASAAGSEVFAQNLGLWNNKLLEGLAALCFMQATIVYKALTNQFPFPKQNEEERISDIIDQNFLPIEYAVKGILPEVAIAVNKTLSLKKETQRLVKSELLDEISKALNSEGTENEEGPGLSEEEFIQRAQEYRKSQNSKIERKRKLRRNSTKIIAIAASLLIVWLFAASIVKSNLSQPTTIGLSPEEVTECFFQSINDKDVPLMMAASKGNQFKAYLTAITNMHVADAASQAYTFTSANQKPQKWFFYAKDPISDSQTSIYGISNLKINGKLSLLDAKTTTKKEKPKIYENASGVENKASTSLNVSYYILQSNSETGEIEVEFTSGSLLLTWLKNRWVLTEIDVDAESIPFDTAGFKADYYSVLNANDGDVVKAVEQLSIRYPWVPSRAVMENQENELKAFHSEF